MTLVDLIIPVLLVLLVLILEWFSIHKNDQMQSTEEEVNTTSPKKISKAKDESKRKEIEDIAKEITKLKDNIIQKN